MPADKSQQLDILQNFLMESQESIFKNHPKAADWLNNLKLTPQKLRQSGEISESESVASAVQSKLASEQSNPLVDSITLEEKREIVGKLRQFSESPHENTDRNQLLYLEQQLGDLLGLSVAAELDGFKMPFVSSRIMSGSHLKRFPSDELSLHQNNPEAGMLNRRGAFGWLTENGNLTDEAQALEQFYLALPLHYLDDWNNNYKALEGWYFRRKVIVVNPYDMRAAVGSVANIGPKTIMQYQSVGSPEIIRNTMAWSQNCQGRVLLLFVDDPDNKVALGPISLFT